MDNQVLEIIQTRSAGRDPARPAGSPMILLIVLIVVLVVLLAFGLPR